LVQMLFQKLKIATKQYNISQVAIAGGVGANTGLRQFQYCTDNAAMIAITGHYKYLAGQFADMKVGPDPRQSLDLRSKI